MPKIKYKYNIHEEPLEVYGTRIYTEEYRDYEDKWTEEKTDFLIYEHNEWCWVDVKDCKPIE